VLFVEKDLPTLPIQLSRSSSIEASAGSSASLRASTHVLGTSVGGQLTGGTSTEIHLQDTISRFQEASLQTSLEKLYEALREDHLLRDDLATIPESTLADAALAVSLAEAMARWGLSDLLLAAAGLYGTDDIDHVIGEMINPNVGSIGEDVKAQIELYKQFKDAPAPERELAVNVWAIIMRASDRVGTAKQEVLTSVARTTSTRFALMRTAWLVTAASTEEITLVNDWLGDEKLNVISKGLIEVSIDPSKLTAIGRQRFVPGNRIISEVFGKIERRSGIADLPVKVIPISIFAT
jgi:hypothetical protein